MISFFPFIVFVILLFKITSQRILDKRVIGGEIAPEDEYHWAVSMKGSVDVMNASATCGASLLKVMGKVQWLLTAAHCFYPVPGITLLDPESWHVRAGLRKVDFIFEKHKSRKDRQNKMKILKVREPSIHLKDLHVEEIVLHPKYRHPLPDNDIALMKLEDPLPVEGLKYVDAIELPETNVNMSWPQVRSKCIVVGWGCTAAGGQVSTIAKLAILSVWSNTKCEESFNSRIQIKPFTEFCAGYRNKNYGLCQGDSGSALACTFKQGWRVAGVVSRVHGRSPGKYPALFTKVSGYVPWILSSIANE